MKRNKQGQLVVENERDVERIINHEVETNPDIDGPDGRDENEQCPVCEMKYTASKATCYCEEVDISDILECEVSDE